MLWLISFSPIYGHLIDYRVVRKAVWSYGYPHSQPDPRNHPKIIWEWGSPCSKPLSHWILGSLFLDITWSPQRMALAHGISRLKRPPAPSPVADLAGNTGSGHLWEESPCRVTWCCHQRLGVALRPGRRIHDQMPQDYPKMPMLFAIPEAMLKHHQKAKSLWAASVHRWVFVEDIKGMPGMSWSLEWSPATVSWNMGA